jgi:hypothetical protein
MCYKAAIASTRGDEATLAKYVIISLEDAIANWYSRPPSGCIYSWQQLKEMFLLNFQGSKRSSIRKKIFCPALKKKKRHSQISTGGSYN